jgi:hypothetical protein
MIQIDLERFRPAPRSQHASYLGAIMLMRRIYRLARAAGYLPLRAFCAIFSDTQRKFLAPTEAEFNAGLDRLIESLPEIAKSHILPDLIAEWHNMPLFGDPEVKDACLTRIRKIDPEMAGRLSLRRHAEMQAAANDPGG